MATYYDRLRVTPVISAAAYVSGDSLQTGFATLNFRLRGTRSARITRLNLIDLADQQAAVDLLVWGADTLDSELVANDAAVITDADGALLLGVAQLLAASYVDVGDLAIGGVDVDIPLPRGAHQLKIAGIVRDTPTYGALAQVVLEVVVSTET